MEDNKRHLFENEQFLLYSICENVYLKYLKDSTEDKFVASIYGDPDSALISFGNDYVAIAGCGVTIFFLNGMESYELGTDPGSIMWSEGIYQSSEDDFNFVRFVAYTDSDQIRVHRLDVFNRKIDVLDK